jgi:16S rRNA (guanine527-N7)-methyltransferase
MSESVYRSLITDACQQLDIALTDNQLDQLLAYHALLVKWNKAYNLTAVRDPREMVERHLVDSLSIIPHLNCSSLLDVGSGGGLPGLVIAIMQPGIQVTVLDSNGKKSRFCQQVKMELQLDNVTVENCRLEAYLPENKPDCITSRAFATLKDMVEKSVACCDTGTRFLAMKGVYPQQELDQLPTSVEVVDVKPLAVPGADGERHLVTLQCH